MSNIIPERMTAEIEGDFVVFLIGMRINKWWQPHKWVPVARAMGKMLAELEARAADETGFLGVERSGGIIVQYWRSFDQLEAYARDGELEHWPNWVRFNAVINKTVGVVGIWHETYLVKAGAYENVYANMPPFGLGKAMAPTGGLVPATGRRGAARGRLRGE